MGAKENRKRQRDSAQLGGAETMPSAMTSPLSNHRPHGIEIWRRIFDELSSGATFADIFFGLSAAAREKHQFYGKTSDLTPSLRSVTIQSTLLGDVRVSTEAFGAITEKYEGEKCTLKKHKRLNVLTAEEMERNRLAVDPRMLTHTMFVPLASLEQRREERQRAIAGYSADCLDGPSWRDRFLEGIGLVIDATKALLPKYPVDDGIERILITPAAESKGK